MLKTNKDTLVNLDFLDSDIMISTNIKFNYPKIEKKSKEGDSLIINNDSITVKLKEIKFDSSKHDLTYRDTSEVRKEDGLFLINGEKFWGTDGGLPETEIGEITIVKHGHKTSLKPNDLKNLYNPWFSARNTNVYIADNDRLILTFWASDGAGGYFVAMIIKNGKLEKRLVEFGF